MDFQHKRFNFSEASRKQTISISPLGISGREAAKAIQRVSNVGNLSFRKIQIAKSVMNWAFMKSRHNISIS